MKNSPLAAVMLLAAVAGAGCDFQRRSTSIAPSGNPPPATSTAALAGTWSSQAVTNELPPQFQGCTNFQWTVTAQSATSIGGTFTATCTAGVSVSGNGTGQLEGNTLAISINGTANVVGMNCSFTITGTGYYENDRITVPYSGQSCYGPFSGVETLRRGSLPGPPPAPAPTPPPPPPPSNNICAFNNGPAIVECVVAKYPERLVAGISLDDRKANMMFLRDRIIEGGLCGGLDFGWNLKRGGPEISIDFLAWRRNDGAMGVDIGFDYDNTSAPLRLQWLEAGLGATYAAFPPPNCGG